MIPMHYSAAWTDSGFLFGCSHEHESIVAAACCIPCAGGYVVGVENGAMRALTAEEESEFQCAVASDSTHNPEIETVQAVLAETAVSDRAYAVMIRIKVGDRWTWTTWMCFGTHAEAAAHAREGNKVVRFQSPEWVALRRQSEPASPIVMKAPRESVLPQSEGEALVDFVLRFVAAYGFPQDAETVSAVKDGMANTDMIDSVLNRLSEWETSELERMYREDTDALVEALGNRFRTVREPESGCC